jgi:crossover junction endodeoxyribonuclease RuvC
VAVDGGRYRLLDAGVISPRSPLGSDDLPGRLADAYDQITAVLAAGRPDLVALEDIFTTPRFPKAALAMAHLRGVLCLAVAKSGVPLIPLTATTVKQRLTGNGHASKEQVQRMVFGLCDVSGVRVPSDLSDAIGLAIAGLHQARVATFAGSSRR